MEAVSNLASGVSKAIWGEPEKTTTGVTNETAGTEPISGELGDVKAGEPYDKGNVEPTTTSSGSTADKDPGFYNSTTSSNPLTMRPNESSTTETPSTTSTAKHDSSLPTTTTGNTPATAPIHPEHETSKTGVTNLHSNSAASATDSAKPSSSNDTSGKGPTPSVGAAPTTGSTGNTKGVEHQGASAPRDTPSSSEHEAIKETKAEAESAAEKKQDPLAEKSTGTGSGGSGGAGIPGVPGSEGLQKESHGEGTGEQYVKSSGMKADGGDFDASKPGAGKEADRLLESKGVHRETPGKKEEVTTNGSSNTPVKETASASSGSSDKGHKKKPSLVEKIKAKVHKH